MNETNLMTEDRSQKSDLRPPTSALTSPPPLPRLLLPGEAEQLASCEQIIERGLHTFIEVGVALAYIRDKRLYRVEFGTWEEYCTARWEISARRATMLCAASETVRNLGLGDPNRNHGSDLLMPASERQARPLVGLPPEEQRAAWAEAVATAPNGRVTARHVEQIVQKRREALGLAVAQASSPEIPRIVLPPVTQVTPVTPAANANGAPAAPPRPSPSARDAADRAELEEIAIRLRRFIERRTADSEAAAELPPALERIEKCRDHMEMLENLQSSRA